jgi:HAD superfamily hydrolase (TIGR01490 family)
MPQEKIILAVFDFDGTLTEGHLWKGISLYNRVKKINRRAVFLYVASHLPGWLAAKIKLFSTEKSRISWGRDLSRLFKNTSVEDLRSTFEWITDHYFMPLMRPDIKRVMDDHQRQGHRVVLLSGMFTEFLEVIGPRIGADDVVGTPLEKKEGVYTGKIVPPLCFGENKFNYLQGWVRKQGLDVDYGESYAYADSIYDSPVFRMVGHPVVVYPDPELLKQAKRSGWKIIGEEGKTPGTS